MTFWPRRTRLVRRLPATTAPVTLVVGIASPGAVHAPAVAAMRLMAGWCGGRDDVCFAEGSSPPEAFARLAAGSELVAIGVARLGAIPGAVTLLCGVSADRLLAAPGYCDRAPALSATLAALRRAGRLPAHRAVLNLEPPAASPIHGPRALGGAITRACTEALALVEAWRLLDRVACVAASGVRSQRG